MYLSPGEASAVETHLYWDCEVASLTERAPPTLLQALGIAIKLTAQGSNQMTDPHTLVFIVVSLACTHLLLQVHAR